MVQRFSLSNALIFLMNKCLFSLIIFIIFISPVLTAISPAQAEELSHDIAIAAMVEAWLYFEISPLIIDLEPDLVAADGSLNIGQSEPVIVSIGTNSPDGWSIEIKGQNSGLKSPAADYTIFSISGTSTLSAGTDGYGANATSSLSGVFIGDFYQYYDTDTVGQIISQPTLLAFNHNRHALAEVARIRIKAAASLLTPAANDYSDEINITLLPAVL